MEILIVLPILAVSSVFTITIAAAESEPPHYSSLRVMAEAAIEDCYEDSAQSVKVQITDESFDEIVKGSRTNLSHNAKCLRYCIMRKNGLLSMDNSIDEENILQIFEIIHPQIKKDSLLDVLHKCSRETDKQTDNCERAFVATSCMLRELQADGITDI
ncbi:general odorant-binding protein 19d-like isoform X3 [Bactrocera neohumeralis]|uniref:general odorant-binding protein 19d-like isoform X2 n=1 Tax=Bactrocera neohumeralis TaxID=98809 RepID=UPI0021661AE3|nr:general odorant-binding protein 19d-like isoform X2 [Bactrocera neohumeralis]XP_050330269.1 general odorant-binding protein 19d-like isoform X3 [Bactrocera neohumeralis]